MNQKREKGITLIALVITIIVLLILAGVTINMVLGDKGIIHQAEEAKQLQKSKAVEEEVELWIANNETAKYRGGEGSIDEATFIEKLKDKGLITDENVEDTTINIGDYEVDLADKNPLSESIATQWSITTDVGEKGPSVGDLITHKVKTNEKFYVIKVDGDNVAMLVAKNITTTGTLAQSDDAPTVAFSDTNYWSSETISNNSLDLNKYTDKTDDEKTSMGVVSTDAIEIARAYGESLGLETGRLMTLEELCSEDIGGDSSVFSTSGCPTWINKDDDNNNLCYWLGSANVECVWYVSGVQKALFDDGWVDDVNLCGVRPVIEVLKSSIE